MDQGINSDNQSDELKAKQIMAKLKYGYRELKKKWSFLLYVSILGFALGLAYAFVKKPVYSAVCSFVLEENSKMGGLGQYAGLASLAGIDIGGSNGLFQGDNIIELYKSRQMIQKTLLGTDKFNGKTQKLIDRYVEFNKLKKKWTEDKYTGNVTFEVEPSHFNRVQDSIITNIVEQFNKNSLFVSKPDKKLSIIQVKMESKDELFAKAFVNKLVENVNEFYIQTKTKKSIQNVKILQFQVDSVRKILNSSISGVASSIDAIPNANPQMLRLRVPSQRKQVDVQASSAIYGEIVKNLELAKISLRQEKPLIQIIDEPILPLHKEKVGKIKGAAFGFILGGFLAAAWIILQRTYKKLSV